MTECRILKKLHPRRSLKRDQIEGAQNRVIFSYTGVPLCAEQAELSGTCNTQGQGLQSGVGTSAKSRACRGTLAGASGLTDETVPNTKHRTSKKANDN